jgi:EmrB/QacA subfamily drug resistance transporter
MTRSAPTAIRSRWLALAVLCAGTLMIILDQTIVNVALPAIQRDLGFSPSSLAWVVNAYLIAFGGLLLLAGRLGDLIGRKRMFVTGLAVFTAASLLCGVAANPWLLITGRFVQGIGGAMAAAVLLGMIVTLFPEPGERTKAIGFFSFVQASGGSIGLLAGGALTQAINWHWIFYVNLPIGIVTALLAWRLLDADRGLGIGAGADVTSAILVTGGLMLGVYTIVRTEQYAWGSAHTLGFGAVAVVLLAAFLVRQATVAEPLLPLRVFRVRNVSVANVVQMLMVAAMFGFQFLGILYLQQVLGYGPVQIGLAILPAPIAIGALSVGVTPRLVTRFGGRPVLLAGLALLVAGLAWLGRAPVDGAYPADVLPVMVLLGIGFGLAFPALMTFAMSGVTDADSGLASGLVNTTQQVGGAFGLAVLVSLAAARTDGQLADGASAATALTSGFHLSFGVGAVLVLIAIALAAAGLRPVTAAEPEQAPEAAQVPAEACA